MCWPRPPAKREQAQQSLHQSMLLVYSVSIGLSSSPKTRPRTPYLPSTVPGSRRRCSDPGGEQLVNTAGYKRRAPDSPPSKKSSTQSQLPRPGFSTLQLEESAPRNGEFADQTAPRIPGTWQLDREFVVTSRQSVNRPKSTPASEKSLPGS